MSLTFIEETHEYFWEGERVPGVSEILSDVGITGDMSFIDPWYRELGSAVHLACQFLDVDELDFLTLDSQIEGYVRGYKKFKEEIGFEPVINEHKVFNSKLKYAGTLDCVGYISTKNGNKNILIDLKTSKSITRITGLQLAAYQLGLDFPIDERWVVQLGVEGTYLVHPFNNDGDLRGFEGAAQLYHWKKNAKKERVSRA